jgi:hypothetical protein
MSSLSPEAYAVIEGRHSDPFRYLGPHLEGEVPVVRVFLPDAERVAIVDEQGQESDLQRIRDMGLFEGRLANCSPRYRVRASYGERQIELEDPYRFPPLLSDLDLYLLGEGTHMQLYDPKPVLLPPGRARLATNPCATGSVHQIEYNGDGACCLLRRGDRRRSNGHDQILASSQQARPPEFEGCWRLQASSDSRF